MCSEHQPLILILIVVLEAGEIENENEDEDDYDCGGPMCLEAALAQWMTCSVFSTILR